MPALPKPGPPLRLCAYCSIPWLVSMPPASREITWALLGSAPGPGGSPSQSYMASLTENLGAWRLPGDPPTGSPCD
eukprot:7623728-Lingulodinium_polyedra.AAC.1